VSLQPMIQERAKQKMQYPFGPSLLKSHSLSYEKYHILCTEQP
jgi:hypothetical protein